MIEIVKLNTEEQQIYARINPILDDLYKLGREAMISNCEKVGELTELLLSRKAIPQHRTDWFSKADLNIGGYGKSRYERFKENAGSKERVFRDPNFITYLEYFIAGPQLPKDTIDGFVTIVKEDRGTTSTLMNELCAYVRKEVRDKQLKAHHAADEFFKLALEVGYDNPRAIYDAAKSVR